MFFTAAWWTWQLWPLRHKSIEKEIVLLFDSFNMRFSLYWGSGNGLKRSWFSPEDDSAVRWRSQEVNVDECLQQLKGWERSLDFNVEDDEQGDCLTAWWLRGQRSELQQSGRITVSVQGGESWGGQRLCCGCTSVLLEDFLTSFSFLEFVCGVCSVQKFAGDS